MNTTTSGQDDKALQPPEHSEVAECQDDSSGWLATLPMLLTLAGLMGLALWGHHTDWTFFGTGRHNRTDPEASADWCKAHGVQETLCIECNAGLLPRNESFGWCQDHGVAECPWCHPEVAQLALKPQVTQALRDRAQQTLGLVDPAKNNPQCQLHQRRLQFPSQEALAKAGVDISPVLEGMIVESVTGNGEITYDLTRVARLTTRAPGTVRLAMRQVGDRVQEGDLLALVDAAEVGRAKAELLQAFTQVQLRAKIWEGLSKVPQVTAARSQQEAAAALREARIRLLSAQQTLINLGLPAHVDQFGNLTEEKLAEQIQFLGLPATITQNLDPRTTTGNLLPIKAPFDGVLVSRELVPGEFADAAKVLFVVADIRRMWLNLDVRAIDAKRLAIGQAVTFLADGRRQEIVGKVSWISTSVDEKTRTVRVRAELDNPDGKLRAGTFGAGRVILREEKNAVVVRKEAVHWEGCCHVVFVRDKDYLKEGTPKVFHIRKVVPGAKDNGNVEIIAGLLPGEVVAAKGSDFLRDQLLKNNLAALCKHAR